MIPESQNNYTYVIMDSAALGSVDFSVIEETSQNTLRYNVASTQFVIKYSGTKPSFLTDQTEYTHAQISALLSDETNGWIYPEE